MTESPRPLPRARRLPRNSALLAAAATVAALAWFWPAIVRRALERYFTAALATPVTIASADVSWVSLAARLEGVEVASPLPGAERPLLAAKAVVVDFEKLDDVLGGGRVRLDRVTAEGAELASESADLAPSTVAALQQRIRASHERAWRWGEPPRVEIGRLSVRNLSLRADERAGGVARTSLLTFGSFDLRDLAIPLSADAGPPAASAVAFSGASLTLAREPIASGSSEVGARAGEGRVALDVSAAPGDPGALAIAVHEVVLADVAVETTAASSDPVGLRGLVDVWHAAVRGLDAPAVASVAVDVARVERGRYRERDPAFERPVDATDVELEAERVRFPAAAGDDASVTLGARPLDPRAHIALRATGAVLAPDGPAPTAVAADFEALPLAPFRDLHVSGGTTTGSARLTVEQGRARGEAAFRLFDLAAAPDAPAGLRAAYGSLRLVAGRETPEVRVPLAFELRNPNLRELARRIAEALALELARSGGRSLGEMAGALGDTAEAIGESARQTVEKAGADLRRALDRGR
ncbi:MAG TPA: hypothetical protein VFD92_04035 [Candidatus Binatia bacterium]|nr:hypothetical protein [Candidatus Binatia bacterium]